jgi:hypothetical protein
MPRGTTAWEDADKEMNKSDKVFVKPEKQVFYFEGIGNPYKGKFGMETPIYVVTEDLEPKVMPANGGLYRQFKAAEVAQFEQFSIFKTLEMVTDENGEQQYAEDGKEKSRNIYHIDKLGKKLTVEQQRQLLTETADEVDISDIPF